MFASPARSLEYHYFTKTWLCHVLADKTPIGRSTAYHYFRKSWLSHVLADEAPLHSTRLPSRPCGPRGGRKGDQDRLGCSPSRDSQTRYRCVVGASLPARRGARGSLIIRLGCSPSRDPQTRHGCVAGASPRGSQGRHRQRPWQGCS